MTLQFDSKILIQQILLLAVSVLLSSISVFMSALKLSVGGLLIVDVIVTLLTFYSLERIRQVIHNGNSRKYYTQDQSFLAFVITQAIGLPLLSVCFQGNAWSSWLWMGCVIVNYVIVMMLPMEWLNRVFPKR
ncbi:hypothetical protein PL11_005500 [Lentilactobacillus curieae]|uniref:Uncharacterized protein n=1 Tax=Lentilactobacillus curieae TaxID=1138822 RepID=A0A1S6QII2_9LACO|nr:hypothetical protein PL11_005500 [Lentilactobacillus curieae]